MLLVKSGNIYVLFFLKGHEYKAEVCSAKEQKIKINLSNTLDFSRLDATGMGVRGIAQAIMSLYVHQHTHGMLTSVNTGYD